MMSVETRHEVDIKLAGYLVLVGMLPDIRSNTEYLDKYPAGQRLSTLRYMLVRISGAILIYISGRIPDVKRPDRISELSNV